MVNRLEIDQILRDSSTSVTEKIQLLQERKVEAGFDFRGIFGACNKQIDKLKREK